MRIVTRKTNRFQQIEQRLADGGWGGLADVDLLALWLGPGRSDEVAWSQACRVYEKLGTLAGLGKLSYPELRNEGLGHRQTLALLASRELFRRSCRRLVPLGVGFHSSAEVFNHFRPLLSDLAKECFWALLLDGKNRILKVEKISEGSLTRSLVHPREVFRPAIREAAAGVLFVHNHPSGAPEPSQEDLEITRRLVETGKVVGIRVLDHVIIGSYRYFSFADEGLL
jgi:DNA repair protein RadC